MGGLPSSTGQLPSAADGSRIDAIPNGRIASAANTNGRAGRGPPSTYAVWSRCRISGPSAPVCPAVRLRSTRCGPCQSAAWDARGTSPGHWPPGIGVRTSQGPWHLRLPPPGPFGVACQGLRHLRSPLAAGLGLELAGGCIRALGTCALSPCLLALRHGGKRVRALGTCAIHPSLNFREDDRLLVRLSVHALVGVRGEGDGGIGVLCCVGLHGHPRAREGEMQETSGASQVHLRLSMEVLLRQLRNLERSRPHCDSICVQ